MGEWVGFGVEIRGYTYVASRLVLSLHVYYGT